MENLIDAGSITFLVNGHVEDKGWISRDDAKILAGDLEKQFRNKLEQSEVGQFYRITSVEWQLGCVLETISFGVAAGLLYKGIKDYPEFRKGLITIANDFKSFYLYLKKKKTQHKVSIYRQQLATETEIVRALEENRGKGKD